MWKSIDKTFNLFRQNYVAPSWTCVQRKTPQSGIEKTLYMDDYFCKKSTLLQNEVVVKRDFGIISIIYNKLPSKQVNFIIFYIEWIYFLFNIKLAVCKGKPPLFNISCYLINDKKLLPSKQLPLSNGLGTYHINSGYAEHSSGTKNVVIYRSEELFKIITHELVHVYEFESTMFKAGSDINLQRLFGKSTPLKIQESLTDAIATVVYVATYHCIVPGPIATYEKRLITTIARERRWLIERTCLVLTAEGFVFDQTGLVSCPKRVEPTAIVSYYLLNALLLKPDVGFLNRNIGGVPAKITCADYIEMALRRDNGGIWRELHIVRSKIKDKRSLRRSYLEMVKSF